MTPESPNPPRVGIDASSVVGPRTGIGYAAGRLLTAFAECWPEDWAPLQVWVNSPRYELPAEDPWIRSSRCRIHSTRWPGKLLLRSWQYLNWPMADSILPEVDVFHSPASYIPPTRSARRIVTVHDVYFKHAPQHVEPYGGGYFLSTFERGLPRVDHIIAVSEFTRSELLRFYDLDPRRISVIPLAVDPGWFCAEPEAGDVERLEALAIEPPFLLCVATVEPRKNLITLIEGFARGRRILKAAKQKVPHLVITGQPVWGIDALTERIEQAGLTGKVHVTGYLPGEMIPTLYRQAMGFVLPSVYEGFGMPVLEAMACGCPVVLAQSGSLPEVAGDAALYFNPKDSDSIGRALARFVAEPHLRESLRQKGRTRAARYSWSACARATLDVYRRVAAGE